MVIKMKKTILISVSVILCIMLCGCSVIFGAKNALETNMKDFEKNLKESITDETDALTRAYAESFSYDVGKQTKDEETGAVSVEIEITTIDIEDLQARASAACGNNQEKMTEWIENAVKKKDYKVTTKQAQVPMAKNDNGKWEIDVSGDIFDFSNAFTGGLGSSIFSKDQTLVN